MTIFIGDCNYWLSRLPENSVNCVVTSPPYYGLRDYGVSGQLGLEETPEAYIQNLVTVFRGIRRVLANDGTVWLNLGDSYWANRSHNGDTRFLNTPGQNIKLSASHARAGCPSHDIFKPKDLMMIPHRVAIALQMDGWWVRSDIVWAKPNPMPESVTDRPTKSHEYVFLLSKSERYFYDADAIREPHTGLGDLSHRKTFSNKGDNGGIHDHLSRDRREYFHTNGRNKRDVWTITTKGYSEAHFATMPQELAETCIAAGCPQDGMVLDPFGGAGTTALAAIKLGRKYQLIELNSEYVGLAQQRIQTYNPMQAMKVSNELTQLSLFEKQIS